LVSEYFTHYGEEYVGYNVHGYVRHVADFGLINGNLDIFFAFKYENYLVFEKKVVKILDSGT